MGYPTKIQLIQRQASRQWYVAFPAALAQALELAKGETVQWSVQDRRTLLLRRAAGPLCPPSKKKRRIS
jgi:antitoxin component of MazEF toxin-antitoxin module